MEYATFVCVCAWPFPNIGIAGMCVKVFVTECVLVQKRLSECERDSSVRLFLPKLTQIFSNIQQISSGVCGAKYWTEFTN